MQLHLSLIIFFLSKIKTLSLYLCIHLHCVLKSAQAPNKSREMYSHIYSPRQNFLVYASCMTIREGPFWSMTWSIIMTIVQTILYHHHHENYKTRLSMFLVEQLLLCCQLNSMLVYPPEFEAITLYTSSYSHGSLTYHTYTEAPPCFPIYYVMQVALTLPHINPSSGNIAMEGNNFKEISSIRSTDVATLQTYT